MKQIAKHLALSVTPVAQSELFGEQPATMLSLLTSNAPLGLALSFRQYIADQVQKLATPSAQGAIANLLALTSLAIPNLIEEFRNARNPEIRSTIVFAISQFKDESVVDFFIQAMDDIYEQTWMNALDGLVNIGGPSVIRRLTVFMVSLNPDDIRGAWTMEAIDQITQTLS